MISILAAFLSLFLVAFQPVLVTDPGNSPYYHLDVSESVSGREFYVEPDPKGNTDSQIANTRTIRFFVADKGVILQGEGEIDFVWTQNGKKISITEKYGKTSEKYELYLSEDNLYLLDNKGQKIYLDSGFSWP